MIGTTLTATFDDGTSHTATLTVNAAYDAHARQMLVLRTQAMLASLASDKGLVVTAWELGEWRDDGDVVSLNGPAISEAAVDEAAWPEGDDDEAPTD